MVKAIVQFQIANGMRIGELLTIKSDNINYEDKTLDIDGTINWVTDKETGTFGVKETTKTSKVIELLGLLPKVSTYSKHLFWIIRKKISGMKILLIEVMYSLIQLVVLST